MLTLANAMAIAGLLATIIFGVWAIRLALRTRYPVRLDFIVEQVIGLLDPLARAIPGISILYEGVPIDRNLILLRGCLVNNGTKDIASEMLEEPVTVHLPPGHSWRAARATASSEGVRATLAPSGGTLTVGFGLLKREEHIGIECLVEAPREESAASRSNPDPGRALLKALTFRHRIADTGAVNIIRIDDVKQAAFRSRFELIKHGTMFLLVYGGLACMQLFFTPKEVHFLVPGANQTNHMRTEVTLTATSDGLLRLRSVSGDYNAKVHPDSIFQGPGPKAVVVSKGLDVPLLVVMGIMPFILLSIGVSGYRDIMHARRIKRMLDSGNGPTELQRQETL